MVEPLEFDPVFASDDRIIAGWSNLYDVHGNPSPDDAAVLDAYVEACECDAPKCLDAKMKTRAAVLARMAHPDRAVLDAADIANRAVLAWISELMDAKPDTPEMVMLKRLSDICHAYESVRYPIGEPK